MGEIPWQGSRIYEKKRQGVRSNRNRRNAYVYWFKKNYCWIWIAVDRLGKKFINFVLGTRGKETGRQLWDKIKDRASSAIIATDHWAAYADFIPAERHIQSKAETYTVEGYNSILRHFLARMRRKSRCYTKSEEMLKYSVILLFEKRNNRLSILM